MSVVDGGGDVPATGSSARGRVTARWQQSTSAYSRFRRLGSTRSVLWSALAALGVVAAGLLSTVAIALVGWALDHAPGTTSADAARLGLQGWFLAHGARLDVPWGVLSLPPMLVSVLILYLLYRTGRQLARAGGFRTVAAAAEATVAVAITYVTAALLLSSLARTADVGVQPRSLAIAAGAFALVGAGLGVVVESGLGHRLLNVLPGPGHAYVRGATAAVLMLVVTSSLTVVASLVVHSGEFAALSRAVTTDPAGGWVIALTSALYLPNAIVGALAFTTGSGFALGTGTTVSLTTVQLGQLPAFPLFAALPDGEGGSLSAWLSAVGPVLAAIVGAVVFVRSLDHDERRLGPAVIGVAGVAVGTSVLTAALAVLSAGALGNGRLASVGPVAWRTGLTAGAVIGVLVAMTVGLVLARGMVTGVACRGTRFDRAERQQAAAIDDEEVVAAVIEPHAAAPIADRKAADVLAAGAVNAAAASPDDADAVPAAAVDAATDVGVADDRAVKAPASGSRATPVAQRPSAAEDDLEDPEELAYPKAV